MLLTSLFCSCKKEKSVESITLKSGPWRATLTVQDDEKLPFLFEVMEDQTLQIFNAEEIITVDEIDIKNSKIKIKFPVFEGYVEAEFLDSLTIKGSFVKESLNRVVPFEATFGELDRFELTSQPKYDVTGSWEAVFSADAPDDRYIAKGVFKQNGNIVTGTFRTTTGDYRYLEGVLNGEDLQLSTFDGAHAFFFRAKVKEGVMDGYFYSGNHWKEPFTAKPNKNYELPSAESLTFLNEGYDSLAFSFPDDTGKMISLQDPEYKGKVVIVQVMGTWCPNCMDETKYYVDFYNKNRNKDVKVISLAFEYARTKEKAFNAIARLKKKLNVNYPVLLAQFYRIQPPFLLIKKEMFVRYIPDLMALLRGINT